MINRNFVVVDDGNGDDGDGDSEASLWWWWGLVSRTKKSAPELEPYICREREKRSTDRQTTQLK